MCVLTDYGLADEFVGVVHRVIRSIAPASAVIDLTHGIARQDVRAGAMALWRAAPFLAPAVVLGIVDPGVATSRRAVALEAGEGEHRLLMVGPDNGLLAAAAHRVGGPRRAVELDDPAWHLPPGPGIGTTFAGRDVFAPAAAHLAAGVDLARLGRPVDPDGLAGEPFRPARPGPGGRVEATVTWVDYFGNAQLDVEPADLPAAGDPPEVAVTVPGGALSAVVAPSFSALGGRPGLVPDSAGLVGLCLDHDDAAARLGLAPGDRVILEPAPPGAAGTLVP